MLALWLLGNITANSVADSVTVAKNEGLLKQVVDLLKSKDERLILEASFIVSTLACKLVTRPEILDQLLAFDILGVLKDLIEYKGSRLIRGEVHFLSLDTLYSLMQAKKDLIFEFDYMGGFEAVEALQYSKFKEVYDKAFKIIDSFCPQNDVVGNEEKK